MLARIYNVYATVFMFYLRYYVVQVILSYTIFLWYALGGCLKFDSKVILMDTDITLFSFLRKCKRKC